MGLDIYIHKTKRTEWKRFQKELSDYENLPESEQNEGNNPYKNFDPEEIGYFRKVNFLMSFFDYDGNCEYKEIAKCELEDLRDACKEISRMKPINKERCAELLPTQSGFFFGNTDYDQWYFNDVREVFEWVDGVLDHLADDEVVLMYCWW